MIASSFLANDVDLEARAVVAGQAIGQLDRRDRRAAGARGQLVPLLTQHVTDHLGLHVYYGSRSAQPARARAFIDLAVERLVGNTQFYLEPHELAPAKGKGRRGKKA
jgi:DNA-binding transcriptional LysR family regulator